MTFDLFSALDAAEREEAAIGPASFLARVDLLRGTTMRSEDGAAFSCVVRLDKRIVCRVDQSGREDRHVWRTTSRGLPWAEIVAFRDELEEHARAYLGLDEYAADAIVTAMVARGGNGASAALRFRKVVDEAPVNGDETRRRSWRERREQALYMKHRWTCEACEYGNGPDCPQAERLHQAWIDQQSTDPDEPDPDGPDEEEEDIPLLDALPEPSDDFVVRGSPTNLFLLTGIPDIPDE